MGVVKLSGTQIGLESTAGTAVAATRVMRRPVIWPKDDRKVEFPREDVAIMGGTTRNYVPQYLATLVWPEAPTTYEDVCYLLSNAVKNTVTGVADGAGTGFVYDYAMPLTSANSIKTQTVEGFDNTQEYETEYAVTTEFTIKGSGGEEASALTDTYTQKGRQVTRSTKTGSLTAPTVEEILFGKGKLYIDAIGGTIGSTQITGTWIGFELTVRTGWVVRFHGDGNLYFGSAVNTGDWEIINKVTMEHNSSAVTEHGHFESGTARLMRMEFLGSALGTPGTHTLKTFRVDLPGVWRMFDVPSDQGGNNIITGEFKSAYNATAALGPSFKVVNLLTSL